MEIVAQGKEVLLNVWRVQIKSVGCAGAVFCKSCRTAADECKAPKRPLFNDFAGFQIASKFNHAFVIKFGEFGFVVGCIWIDISIADFLQYA